MLSSRRASMLSSRRASHVCFLEMIVRCWGCFILVGYYYTLKLCALIAKVS